MAGLKVKLRPGHSVDIGEVELSVRGVLLGKRGLYAVVRAGRGDVHLTPGAMTRVGLAEVWCDRLGRDDVGVANPVNPQAGRFAELRIVAPRSVVIGAIRKRPGTAERRPA